MCLDDGKIYEAVSDNRSRYFRGEVKAGKKIGADIAVNVAQKPLEDVMQENSSAC